MTRNQAWAMLVVGVVLGIICIVLGVHWDHRGHGGYHPHRALLLFVVGALLIVGGLLTPMLPRMSRRRV